MFPADSGRAGPAIRTRPGAPQHRLRRRIAVTTAGLQPALRFQDLRHTCAALLIASGAHLQEVKEHLGHSSIRTTSDRYGHLYEEFRDALRDRLDFHYADFSRTSEDAQPPELALEGQNPAVTCDDVERTTGFEPATLTLAR